MDYNDNATTAANADEEEHSSPESVGAEDDDASNSTGLPRPAPPMQKRRRVTRACDECRRKKIKCDGKQPCTHCTIYSYDCTYDQPSNRRRNPAPQYIEALEVRLQRAEALLRTFNSNIDLNDPNLDRLIQQRQGPSTIDAIKAQVSQQKPKPQPGQTPDQDARLQSMIENTGQLDLDEQGHWDFHGSSSGAMFLRRMREQFGGILGDVSTPFMPRPKFDNKGAGESPRSIYESPQDAGHSISDLPSRSTGRVLCRNALTKACALLRFVHLPTFYQMYDRIYDVPPESYTDEEHRFLPLLYQVLALGCMFTDDSEEAGTPGESAYKTSIEQGMKFFRASRNMIDITDCRDLTSLQCILFMILFLQSTSNLSTCYSYVGVALRSAVRMGLHRNMTAQFNPIERETRRRIFWIIRKMDTYVSALLGFPRMLSDADIDQDLPIEVDDEYITKDGILPMPEGTMSMYAASNAHTRLMDILAKVIAYIYPIKGIEQCTKESSTPGYTVSHSKIREIERDLQEWLDKLPMGLRPGGDVDSDVMRCQQLLRMAYAHVQMMLYRPFLHYVSHRLNANKNIDERSYACAAACVSVSRNIVHICAELQKQGLLVGAYWFTMYTTFFAILSLVFFVLENPDKQGTQEILSDAMAGKEALKGLAQRSMAADRCSIALESFFEKLPSHLKRPSTEPTKPKKRTAPTGHTPISAPARSSPDLHKPMHNTAMPLQQAQRATTFPVGLGGTNTPARQNKVFAAPQYSASQNPDPTAIRRGYNDFVSPAMSAVGTPDSSSTGHSMQAVFNSAYPPAAQAQPYAMGNANIPELGAMMFPSADPFAYPNQPMTEFDQRLQNQQQDQKMSTALYDAQVDGSNNALPNVFMTGNENTNPSYDNLQGQLFGPLPPYLMQGQPMDVGMNYSTVNTMMPGQGFGNAFGQGQGSGGILGNGMNFDDIFVGSNDEWGNMVGGQGFRR